MENTLVVLAKTHNENVVRASVNQLSNIATHIMLEGKVDKDLYNRLCDLIQKLGDTQREVSVLLSEMNK